MRRGTPTLSGQELAADGATVVLPGARPSVLGVRMLRDAGWIALASLLAAGVGVVFWAVAARSVSPTRLGVETAVLAAIMAPASIIASGIGDALIAVAAANPMHRAALIRHAYYVVLSASLPAGALAGAAAMSLLPDAHDQLPIGLTVFVGVGIWALFTIQDSALTVLGKTRWLPVENALAGCAKLVLVVSLPVFVTGVVWATLVPAACAVLVLIPTIGRMSGAARRSATKAAAAPRPVDARAVRRSFTRLALRTASSIVLTLGALTFLPFVVTVVAGPAQGALLAIALSVTAVLDYLTGAVGTALVLHLTQERVLAHELLRFALKRALAVVAAAAALLIVLIWPLLRMLDPAYLGMHGVAVVTILAATSVIRTVYLLWSSRQQARQEMGAVLRLNAFTAVLAYAMIFVLAGRFGALAGAAAIAIAQLILSAAAVHHLRAEASTSTSASGSDPRHQLIGRLVSET